MNPAKAPLPMIAALRRVSEIAEATCYGEVAVKRSTISGNNEALEHI
jgi:hypothetical protein